jgi:hypothetical protein
MIVGHDPFGFERRRDRGVQPLRELHHLVDAGASTVTDDDHRSLRTRKKRDRSFDWSFGRGDPEIGEPAARRARL